MRAIWHHEPKSYRARRHHGYSVEVKVLDVRKRTARIEYRRWDGKIIRRFTKLSRLIMAA